MNKIIFTLLLLAISALTLRAEYNGWYFKIEFELENQEKIQSYVYSSSFNGIEDLSKGDLVEIDLLKGLDYIKEDTIVCFLHLIKYTRSFPEDTNKYNVYKGLQEVPVPLRSIKNAWYLGKFMHSYAINILSEISLEDTLWMKTTPIKSFDIWGAYCSFQIYVHQNNTNVEALINEMKEASQKFIEERDQLHKELKSLNDSEMKKRSREYDILERDQDDKLFEYARKFNGLKVIVIDVCTC